MPSADYRVELVDSSGEADMTVAIIGDQVVDISGGVEGQMLRIGDSGAVELANPDLLANDAGWVISPLFQLASDASAYIAGPTIFAGTVSWVFDATDFLQYVRGSNSFGLTVGNVLVQQWGALGNNTFNQVAGTVASKIRGAASQTADLMRWEDSAAATLLSVGAAGHLAFGEGVNITAGTTTGTKIGTATTQKLGFFNATPVVRPANTTDLRTALIDLGLLASGGATPLNLNGGTLTAATGAGGGTGGLTVGDMGAGASSYYGIAHSSMATTSSYALIQNNLGQTAINAASTRTVTLGINNAVKLTLAATSLTFADAVNIAFNATTGTKIGTATTEKLAFYGVTPIVQRAGADQAAVATTGATNVAPFGYTTAAQANAIVTLVNELRTALVNLGLIKGAA